MRQKHEPEATRLRKAGKLWPECLSDEELRRELHSHEANAKIHPISLPMLQEEMKRRGRLR